VTGRSYLPADSKFWQRATYVGVYALNSHVNQPLKPWPKIFGLSAQYLLVEHTSESNNMKNEYEIADGER
jgi:hypothetical protein